MPDVLTPAVWACAGGAAWLLAAALAAWRLGRFLADRDVNGN